MKELSEWGLVVGRVVILGHGWSGAMIGFEATVEPEGVGTVVVFELLEGLAPPSVPHEARVVTGPVVGAVVTY